MITAFFDVNGVCLGTSDGSIPEEIGVIFVEEVPDGTSPNDIWHDGVNVVTREDEAPPIPEYVTVGDPVTITVPAESKVKVSGVIQAPVAGEVTVDTSVEDGVVIEFIGRKRYVGILNVFSTDRIEKLTERQALKLHQLRNATPTQINNYIDNNVTDLDSAKQVLKTLAKFILISGH
jgi:hypothetical protein